MALALETEAQNFVADKNLVLAREALNRSSRINAGI